MPPPRKTNDDADDEDTEAQQQARPVELPRPPTPPQGKWRNEPMTAFDSLHETLASLSGLGGGHHNMGLLEQTLLPSLHNIRPFRRDPNSFYYKPDRPTMPQSSFSLECEQWRHGGDSETFLGEIHFAQDQTSVAGALECEIHAENLSHVTSSRVPVRITVSSVSVFERADLLVQALTGASPAQRTQASETG
jgi:hypothetical protein